MSAADATTTRAGASEAPPPIVDPTRARALQREEAAIARRYLGRLPWEMVAWGLGNCLVWLSLWPLVFFAGLPLWIAFPIATLNCILAYLPSHEAQHSIIGAAGTRWRWLNELVGHVSLFPLVFGYRVAWITHKQHHAHANDDELDPDISSRGDTWWQSLYSSFRSRQPGYEGGYARVMRETEDPARERALAEMFALRVIHFGVLTACAWSGHAFEALFLWWLPRHLGFAYIQLFLSWLPHHPMRETGRYRDTRAWRSRFGTIVSLGMEYHVIHHLYPRIPLLDTPKAFSEMEGLLAEQGWRDDRPATARGGSVAG